MYLKSIEVQGFKSFANKMIFEFHNGITGIVGPNGSGKSNVADAVRWVLGEQSAKQLRGGNMQDVIFSGTETRKPQGFAFVAITLDNSDHKLDIEYEEVTVARRLYRSGESEYLINGTSCRLKDINELFYDTGIGKEGYSIIGQGQIDRILSGKPEERRELFDEAAGIVKFKRRKNTALKKLEEEKQNLLRVTDILSELTRQLAPLERQSETARIYLKKKEELKVLDVNMFLLESSHIKEQLSKVEASFDTAQRDLQDTRDVFEKTKLEYEQLELDMEQLDTKIAQSREDNNQNTLLKQQLEAQIEILKEQINASRQNDEHYKNRIEAVQADLLKRQEEEEKCQSNHKRLEEELLAVEERQKKANEKLEKLHEKSQKAQQSMEDAKNELIDILNARTSTKGKMQRYDAMLEQISIRKATISQQMLNLKTQENAQTEAFEEQKQIFDDGKEKINDFEETAKKLQQQIGVLQMQLQKKNHQMEVGQTAYHRESSRLESLRNLTERYDGYGNSVKKVMEQKDRIPGIKGVVADLIKVSKQYETAVETALGGSIQNIVTDQEQTAKQMIEYLKKNRFGRATFLPLTAISSRGGFNNPQALKEQGVIGIASDLVSVSDEYKDLAVNLLGKTLVIDHMDHAIVIGRKYRHSFRMVTLEGELLNAGGSMTGGAFKNNSNLLGRRREIEELNSSVATLKSEMEAMQESIEQTRKKRNELRAGLEKNQAAMQNQQIQQNTAQLSYRAAKEKLEEIQQRYGRFQREANEIEAQIREIQENSQQIQTEIKDSEEREELLKSKTDTDQSNLDALLEEEKLQNEKLEEIHLAYANITQKAGFNQQNLKRILEEKQTLIEEQNQINQNLENGSDEIEKKEQDILKIQETIQAAVDTGLAKDEEIASLIKDKENMTRDHKAFFDRRDELSERMNLLDKECFRLNNQREKFEENQENQITYMWEEYELTPQRALELKNEELNDRSSMKKSVNALRDEIRKLGSVNVNAIEEYKELSERHSFLSAQYEDLVKAEKTLVGIIEELDTGMRKQFTEKFAEIRVEFDKAFKELFGGGKGSLELDDNEDVLEAAITIVSQPPGKKLQNMMQLSGGEKALTAIALLFAIQNLKPSPFCLLDEIEAALDDSNVTRYAKYLHKLTKNTQFIIITHRRGTMNAADRLYGITMQEKGVSTLVSVNLIENELDK